MVRRGSIISFIWDNAPLEILFVFILAFICKVSNIGFFNAVIQESENIYNIIYFSIVFAILIIVYLKREIAKEVLKEILFWIWGKITRKKRF